VKFSKFCCLLRHFIWVIELNAIVIELFASLNQIELLWKKFELSFESNKFIESWWAKPSSIQLYSLSTLSFDMKNCFQFKTNFNNFRNFHKLGSLIETYNWANLAIQYEIQKLKTIDVWNLSWLASHVQFQLVFINILLVHLVETRKWSFKKVATFIS
jgi:hypothetical protein